MKLFVNKLGNIRSKVWLCVIVALLGYLTATLISFYSNTRQAKSLADLRNIFIPLAMESKEIEFLFKKQISHYEDAIVDGEVENALKGNDIFLKIIAQMNEMVLIIKGYGKEPHLENILLSLIRRYSEYIKTAGNTYAKIAREDNFFELGDRVHQLAVLQSELIKDIEDLSLVFAQSMEHHIEKSKETARFSIIIMGAFFFFVLIATTLMINMVANRLLIFPLLEIRKLVKRFGLEKSLVSRPAFIAGDEISELGDAFWQMTKNLKETSVSKDYLDNILKNISGFLIVTDPHGTIKTVNPNLLETLSYTEEEVVGHRIEMLFYNGKQFLEKTGLNGNLKSGFFQNMELEFLTKSGVKIPIILSTSVVLSREKTPVYIICSANDISERKKFEQQLNKMAHFDSLTGLPNRNLFFDRFRRDITNAKRYKHKLGILYLDLDRFKEVNDTMGHDAGDLVLKETSKRLTQALRKSDSIARMGGDEFTIILGQIKAAKDAEAVARKIISAISKPYIVKTHQASLGVSIGLSLFPEDADTMEGLIKSADAAMYRAKQKGPNSFCQSFRKQA